ncbi:MAG: LamG-like jellyroll fold domain-containing protein, partial [Phycisphaerae bacterium]
MGIYSNDNVEFEVRSSAGTSAPPSRPGGGTMLQTDTWYFVGGTYSQTADGGIITTYVNGELDAEMVTTIVMDPSSGTFVIGRDPSAPGAGQFIGVIDEVRVYNHVLTENELRDAMLGKWPPSEIAFAPRPEDEQVDVPRDSVLGWKPGIYAQTHDVYFGSVFEDVNNADRNNSLDVLVRQDQDVNMYEPGLLDFGQTYFWRIDDINAVDSTIHTGDIWRFTTETIGYPIPGDKITATASSFQDADTEPVNTIDGSGLVNDLHSIDTTNMWLSDTGDPGSAWIQYDFDKPYKLYEMLVWNYNGPFLLTGFSIRDVTIEYSTDGATWTVLPDAKEFAQAPGADGYQCNTTIDFGSVVAKSVRITANSNWGGPIFNQYGLSEVRFLYIPVNAREPSPGSGATDVDLDVPLRWRPGREAVTHDVYFSDDEQAVIDGTAPVETVTDTSYSPLSLDLGKTYYWKINEVNMAETPTTLEGDVWSFSTREYIVVDDFEGYGDYPPDEIWSTWPDGYENPLNGSIVGYPNPDWGAGEHYVETTIVHGGKQSMPLFYSNTEGAAYSEAERTFDVPQDWTEAGVQTLVLFFHGTADNTGQLYVKVNGSKVVYEGDAADIERPIWKQWNIDLASLGVDLQNVTTMSIGIDGNGASGTLYFDDIRLYELAPTLALEEIWIEAEAAEAISAPLLIMSDVAGASGGQCIQAASEAALATGNPPTEGIATYTLTVLGGTYVIRARTAIPTANQDAFWFRIQGATVDRTLHSSGWCQWNTVAAGTTWHWDDVHSSQSLPANQTVNWTMPAGTYKLQIAYMDVGFVPPMLDALMIVKVA